MTLQCKGLAVACSNAAVRRLCSNQKTRSSESIHGLCERTEIVYLYKFEKMHTSKDFQSLFVTKYCCCAYMGYIHALKLRTKLTLCTNTNGIKKCKVPVKVCQIYVIYMQCIFGLSNRSFYFFLKLEFIEVDRVIDKKKSHAQTQLH